MTDTDDGASGDIAWPELEHFLRGLTNADLVELVGEQMGQAENIETVVHPRLRRLLRSFSGDRGAK